MHSSDDSKRLLSSPCDADADADADSVLSLRCTVWSVKRLRPLFLCAPIVAILASALCLCAALTPDWTRAALPKPPGGADWLLRVYNSYEFCSLAPGRNASVAADGSWRCSRLRPLCSDARYGRFCRLLAAQLACQIAAPLLLLLLSVPLWTLALTSTPALCRRCLGLSLASAVASLACSCALIGCVHAGWAAFAEAARSDWPTAVASVVEFSADGLGYTMASVALSLQLLLCCLLLCACCLLRPLLRHRLPLANCVANGNCGTGCR